MGSRYFHPCFIPSAGIPCSTDRHLEKRNNEAYEGIVVAEKVLMDLSKEPAPVMLYVLQARDESAYDFDSCGYWLSFRAFKSQENVRWDMQKRLE